MNDVKLYVTSDNGENKTLNIAINFDYLFFLSFINFVILLSSRSFLKLTERSELFSNFSEIYLDDFNLN